MNQDFFNMKCFGLHESLAEKAIVIFKLNLPTTNNLIYVARWWFHFF